VTYPTFTDGTSLPATDLNAIGLWLVKSQTIGNGVSTQNITSCFTANYDNYLVTINGMTSTGGNGGTINFKLLSGTTPTTSGFYGNIFYVVSGGGGGLSNAPAVNNASAEFMSITTSSLNSGQMMVQAPFLTQQTHTQGGSTDNNYFRINSFAHTLNNSYDGLQIIPSAGTITGGTIRVYGMRN
jgi:hypothetical protein